MIDNDIYEEFFGGKREEAVPEKKSVHKRKFETYKNGEGWMNNKVDDILYGYLKYAATYNMTDKNNNHRMYITKKKFLEGKQTIMDFTGKSAKTITNHMNVLIENNIIEEFTTERGELAYGLVENKDAFFKLLDVDWLFYLISTRNKFVLKVYVYLLDKYEWKQKEADYYTFTIKELLEAIGYTSKRNPTAEKAINNVLESLQREGIISYEDYIEKIVQSDGNVIPRAVKRLKKVCFSKEELDKYKK